MKKRFIMALCFVLVSSCAFAFTPGTYEGTGKGYSEGAPVKVKVTVDAEKITAVEIDAPEEVPFGVQNFETYRRTEKPSSAAPTETSTLSATLQ